MYAAAVKSKKENKSRAAAHSVTQKKNSSYATFHLVDSRPETIVQRKMQEMMDHSARIKQLREQQQGRISVVQRTRIAGIPVTRKGRMPEWTQDGKLYHINLTTETHHVTEDDNPKIHFFYRGSGQDIVGARPTKQEEGKAKKKKWIKKKKFIWVNTKKMFEDLPIPVQEFIKSNYLRILAAE